MHPHKYYILFISSMISFSCQAQHLDIEPSSTKIKYELIVEDITNPWGMEFLPNGDLLVTEKEGEIRIIRDGKLLDKKVTGVPDIYVRGQGGLMDIKLHPDFERNQWIYLSYASSEGSGSGGNTAIARFTYNDGSLSDKKVLYKATPNSTAGVHFGSRLEFDRDGYLYFTIGERGNRSVNPQDISRDMGKVYRIHDDGRIPSDNPFVNTAGAKKAIYSYGHRNPQGMEMNPTSGKIWTHEHGPQGGDEVNIVKPGKNYGWPVISYGINYNGTKFTDITAKKGMDQPILYWVPSIAPCGMTFVRGNKYPGWDGDLIVGSLKFFYLIHATVDGDKIVKQEEIAKGIGRVRSVELSPDGYIYVGVEGKGIYKLVMGE